jgi:glucose-6-phosphate dehydrogenase assembly protein OpcA
LSIQLSRLYRFGKTVIAAARSASRLPSNYHKDLLREYPEARFHLAWSRLPLATPALK